MRGWAEQLSGGGGRPGLGPRWVTDEAEGLRCWLPPAARHTLHGHPVPPLDGDERLRSVSCVLIAERAATAPISIRGTQETPRSGAGLCLLGRPPLAQVTRLGGRFWNRSSVPEHLGPPPGLAWVGESPWPVSLTGLWAQDGRSWWAGTRRDPVPARWWPGVLRRQRCPAWQGHSGHGAAAPWWARGFLSISADRAVTSSEQETGGPAGVGLRVRVGAEPTAPLQVPRVARPHLQGRRVRGGQGQV